MQKEQAKERKGAQALLSYALRYAALCYTVRRTVLCHIALRVPTGLCCAVLFSPTVPCYTGLRPTVLCTTVHMHLRPSFSTALRIRYAKSGTDVGREWCYQDPRLVGDQEGKSSKRHRSNQSLPLIAPERIPKDKPLEEWDPELVSDLVMAAMVNYPPALPPHLIDVAETPLSMWPERLAYPSLHAKQPR
eukprot:954114-Rhodomonas_salina.1